jgi:hypothetical protein
MEENIEAWNFEKRSKYTSELTPNLSPGWSLEFLMLEVGARGWSPPNLQRGLGRLGFNRQQRREIVGDCSDVSRRCSYIIWLNRFNRDFVPLPIYPFGTKATDNEFIGNGNVKCGQSQRDLKARDGGEDMGVLYTSVHLFLYLHFYKHVYPHWLQTLPPL